MIKEKRELEKIHFIDLDKHVTLDEMIEYSKLFPNRLIAMDCYTEMDKDKIKQIADLNSESLIYIPSCQLNLYRSCKNISTIFGGRDFFPKKTPNDFDFSKITKIICCNFDNELPKEGEEIDDYLSQFDKNEIEKFEQKMKDEVEMDEDEILLSKYKILKLIFLIHKCQNLKKLEFSTSGSLNNIELKFFFSLLKLPKLKTIYIEGFDLDEEYNFETLLNHCPNLEIVHIEEHCTMSFSYNILPCYHCENCHMDFPSMEKLIKNYLNEKPYHLLKIDGGGEIDEWLNYFKDKKEIMNRIRFFNFEPNESNIINIESAKQIRLQKALVFNIEKIGLLNIEKPVENTEIQKIIKMKPDIISSSVEISKETVDKLRESIPNLKVIIAKDEIAYFAN